MNRYDLFQSAACGAAAKSDPQNTEAYLPLWMHALDTAGIMQMLCQHWLSPAVFAFLSEEAGEDTLRLCTFLGLVHDIGKVSALFQHQILRALPGYDGCKLPIPDAHAFAGAHATPHARAGEAILLWGECPASIAAIVGAHHGRPQSELCDLETDIDSWPRNYYGTHRKVWEQSWRSYLRAALAIAGFVSADDLPEVSVSAQVLLTGLLIMADWIASNAAYFPLISIQDMGSATVYPDRVEAAWRKLQLPQPWAASCCALGDDAFCKRFGVWPNAVQRAVLTALHETVQPGILVLEAQMGVGKTEAALAGAELLAAKSDSSGLFFGLPTQATANGLFPRIRRWAETIAAFAGDCYGIRLAHGAAAMNEDYRQLFHGSARLAEDEDEGGLIAHSWFEGRKQALLQDFVIGTVDQLLMAGLRQKHMMLRHLGLAGKVVVIDECHAYSPYMNRYLDRVLTWLGEYGSPVIILSATLLEERREQLIYAYLQGKARGETLAWQNDAAWKVSLSYPLLTWTDGLQVRQTALKAAHEKTVYLRRGQTDALAHELREKLAQGGCAGIIVNTVHRAQRLAAQLRCQLPEMEVLDFHAQFVMADRVQREQVLLQRLGKSSTPEQRQRLIVVGTQVLEQSLDIDFDLLATDLCPMDLLLQRMGRLHRHAERLRPAPLQTPHCILLEADADALEPGACAIYGEWLLLQTCTLLPDTVGLPEDIPRLVQAAYRRPEEARLTARQQAAWSAYENARQCEQNAAYAFLVEPPVHSMFGSSIHGMLDRDIGDNDPSAQASVRGGEPSLEVLVLVRSAAHQIFLLHDRAHPLDASHVPSEQECRLIAQQRLRLSAPFRKIRRLDAVIEQLEEETRAWLWEWQQSHWLRGELFLLLDENGEGTLCGYHLRYTLADGLCVQKEEENGGKSV